MNEFKTAFFIPGANEKMLAKAADINADLIIFDLEDSVLEAQKQQARKLVTRALQASASCGSVLAVRVNSLDTAHVGKDVEAVMQAHPDVIVLPKTETGEQLDALSKLLDQAETKQRLTSGSTKIIAITAETPKGLLEFNSLHNNSNRLIGLSWGPEDLATELGASNNRDESNQFLPPFELVRTLCLAKARALGVQPIDTVFTNIHDVDGLKNECISAKNIGYTGKLAIHPSQVDIINEVFTPSAEELEQAREIVELFEANPDQGAFQLHGKMIDIPHVKIAKRVLSQSVASRKK